MKRLHMPQQDRGLRAGPRMSPSPQPWGHPAELTLSPPRAPQQQGLGDQSRRGGFCPTAPLQGWALCPKDPARHEGGSHSAPCMSQARYVPGAIQYCSNMT